MIPKEQRITKRLFSESFSYSKSISNDYFTLKYKAILEFPSKISVVVSKKVVKSAVGRNALKRLFYENVQKSTKILKKPYILMFFPKKESITIDKNKLSTLLGETLKKI